MFAIFGLGFQEIIVLVVLGVALVAVSMVMSRGGSKGPPNVE